MNVSLVATEEEASPQQRKWQDEEEIWYASGDADVCLNMPDACYTVELCKAVERLPEYSGRLLYSGALHGC